MHVCEIPVTLDHTGVARLWGNCEERKGPDAPW
jgi:hypothetical protein